MRHMIENALQERRNRGQMGRYAQEDREDDLNDVRTGCKEQKREVERSARCPRPFVTHELHGALTTGNALIECRRRWTLTQVTCTTKR